MVMNENVRVFRTVDDIGKEGIDSISIDGFFTYGYFKALETSNAHNVELFYIVVYENDKIVGVAPCFFDSLDILSVSKAIKKMLSLGSRLGLLQKRVLICYSPLSFHSQILIKERRKSVFDLVLMKVDEICKEEGIRFSLFPFVSEFDRSLIDRLQNFGYLKLLSRKTLYLDIKWSSFEDYLTSLGRNARHNIRKQIKNFKKSEAIIEEASEFKEFSETFSDLYSNLFSKYNKGAKNPYTASFFSKLYEYARDKTEVFVAKRNGKIVGFCFCLRQGDILDCFICGFNYDALKRAASVYFNIGYYAPISWAIKEGIKRIHYRMAAEEVKLRRGCQPEETYWLLKCQNKCQNRLIGMIFHLYTKIRSRSANNL